MNIDLGILKDGGVLLLCDRPLPHIVKRVEFYQDQRLFMLVYHQAGDDENELMHHEIPERMVYPIQKSPDVMIYTMFENEEPVGYKVPLISVGDIY